jgi:hypothetical protein
VITVISRETFLDRAATYAGSRMLAHADLDVYCPEHGGYRDECRCPPPGPGGEVTVDSRYAPWRVWGEYIAAVAAQEPAGVIDRLGQRHAAAVHTGVRRMSLRVRQQLDDQATARINERKPPPCP